MAGRKKLQNRLTGSPRWQLLPPEWSGKKIAEHFGLHPTYVNSILSGKHDPQTPTADMVRAFVAEISGKSISEIFPGL